MRARPGTGLAPVNSSGAGLINDIIHERRVELAFEGHRYFDLVRWGIAATEINKVLDYNGGVTVPSMNNKRGYLTAANFTANKNEYFPIPASIIDVAAKYGNTLTQNPGY